MTLKLFLKTSSKNTLTFLIGSIIGLLSTFITVPITLYQFISTHTGIGAIAGMIVLIPVLFITYGILGIIVGGLMGVVVHNIIKYFRKM